MNANHTALACAAVASLLAFAATSAAAAPADPVARVLNGSRTALGGPALQRVRILELDSKIVAGGLPGTGRSWQQIGGLHFAESYSNPPIAGGDGYDGTDAWNRDGSGLVWIDGGTAGRSQEISQAFASNYALWAPNRGGASVTWGGTKTLAGKACDVLVVTAPGSAVPFEFWFDRSTHLPVQYVQTIGPDTVTTMLSDYRPVDGVKIPYKTHTATTSGNTIDATVVRAVANPPGGRAHLAKPASDVHDFSILGGATQTSVPIDLVENHVYLSLELNGKGPYRFIYDTGGANIVDPAVASEIGALGHGSVQGGGVGAKTESVSFATVDSMQIGDAIVKHQLFGVAPTRMGFGVSAGQRVDGLIGFEVLSRFITTFDYAHDRVVLQMPGAASAAGSDVLPFVLDGRQPQFACGIDGIATQCTVDTGARDSITLMGPFIAAHPRVVPQKTSAIGVSGFGFGGPALGKLGRLQSLGIGTFALPDIVADFTTQEKGAFAQPFVAANVGGNVWRRFTLTLDYGKRTMALTPNADFSTPDSYERAGMFLLNQGGKYVVLDARPGTPAAQAGIVPGDTIDTIDGKAASSMSLQAVRQLFFGAPGTALHLGLTAKDGTRRTVTLTLRDYV